MSNLIKSGFIAFAKDDTLVIDANKSKIIQTIDTVTEQLQNEYKSTVEEALAEALIQDAELDGTEFDENMLTMDTDLLSEPFAATQESQQRADSIIDAAKQEADSIIERAHDEAEKLRADAYDEAEQIREQARHEGFQNGYEEGLSTAGKEMEEKNAAFEQRVEETELEFLKKEEKLIKETEKKMTDLLCQLIPTITGVVIENQKDVLLYIINTAMQDLDNSKHFVIKVSCEDYEELVERKDEIYGALNPAIEVEIFEDAKLTQMQCIIETDNGIVDVSLDVQLDNLNKALKLMIKE